MLTPRTPDQCLRDIVWEFLVRVATLQAENEQLRADRERAPAAEPGNA